MRLTDTLASRQLLRRTPGLRRREGKEDGTGEANSHGDLTRLKKKGGERNGMKEGGRGGGGGRGGATGKRTEHEHVKREERGHLVIPWMPPAFPQLCLLLLSLFTSTQRDRGVQPLYRSGEGCRPSYFWYIHLTLYSVSIWFCWIERGGWNGWKKKKKKKHYNATTLLHFNSSYSESQMCTLGLWERGVDHQVMLPRSCNRCVEKHFQARNTKQAHKKKKKVWR